jgi:single-strand DNA-binding protein
MREGYNHVALLGNVGKDPILRGKVLAFSLATNERYFDSASKEWKEETNWHDVAVFGARAESLAKLLQKGEPVFVEGRLRKRDFQTRDGQKQVRVEVIAERVVLLGGPKTGSVGSAGPSTRSDADEDYGGDYGSE